MNLVYYGTSFAGIDRGWYREAEGENYATGRHQIDSVWNSECDAILLRYIELYGIFYTAFSRQVIEEVDLMCGSNLVKARYYEYYLATRALEIPSARRRLEQDEKVRENQEHTCRVCSKKELLVSLHPSLVVHYGFPANYCGSCGYQLKLVPRHRHGEVATAADAFRRGFNDSRTCDVCGVLFKCSDLFAPAGLWDRIYPNLYASVCLRCVIGAFYSQDVARGGLDGLRCLERFLGKVPPHPFTALPYLYSDGSSIGSLYQLLAKVPLEEWFKLEFGSYFGALVASGVLPNGSRRMRMGTMTLANDGHICLSLVEKEIDDWLYEQGIIHEKEVGYPDSQFRADWELFGANHRTFCEYFGLMSRKDYAVRANLKRELASSAGIELLGICPEERWVVTLETWAIENGILRAPQTAPRPTTEGFA